MPPTTETVVATPAVRLLPTKARKHDKAMFLSIVETLVERAGRIGELLKRRGTLAHHLGTQVQPLNRILRMIHAGTRGKSLRALLSEVTQRAFEPEIQFQARRICQRLH